MCAGGRLSGSQPPARVLKSHLWNWFHGPFGRAQRRPVPKKMPAARSAHDADSEPGAAAIASRLSQLKKSRAPYLGGGAGPAKSGDHSSPEGMARTDLRRSLWAGN